MAESRPDEQFADFAQQAEVAKLGMWVFLATEVMFFGGLFAAYLAYRLVFPVDFVQAAGHTDILLGSVNTVVLLSSSLTMALAMADFGDEHRRRSLRLFLTLTLLLGLAFIGIKGVEYWQDYREHLVPGLAFAPAEPMGQGAQLFFLLYFLITGLHGVHMAIGIGLVVFLLFLSRRQITPQRCNTAENVALYWSFVDVMWIFIFTLLYLPGRRG